jgi:hypothetical protein
MLLIIFDKMEDQRMRIILPLIVLMLVVLACGRFGSGPGAGSNANRSNSAPTAAAKAVDMPSLVGRSNEEIKSIVGVEPKYETPYLAIELPQGELTVDSMKGKQTSIGFKPKGTAYATPDKLGDLVGIDLKGIPVPTSSGEYYFYDDVKTPKGTLKRVSLHKTGDSFDQISIDFDSL